jgi:hypothetical protein
MEKLEEVYTRLVQNKKELRDLRKMISDEFTHIPRYQEIKDEIKVLREELKGIENGVKAGSSTEVTKMEDLKIDITADTEMLADIALNMYVKNEPVEIVDENNQTWHPEFKVNFKRG